MGPFRTRPVVAQFTGGGFGARKQFGPNKVGPLKALATVDFDTWAARATSRSVRVLRILGESTFHRRDNAPRLKNCGRARTVVPT